MIRNNLAKLMIDRGISATQLFNDTGIARSTISKISNNNTDKISLQTIDKICNSLGVSPADFFDYIPYEIEVEVVLDRFDNIDELRNYYKRFPQKETEKFEIILNVMHQGEKNVILFNGTAEANSLDDHGSFVILTNSKFKLSDNSMDSVKKINSLPIQFQTDILQKIKSTAINTLDLLPIGEFDEIGLEVFNSY